MSTKHAYLMARIRNGRGFKVDRDVTYGHGWANGTSTKRYSGGEFLFRNGERVKGGRLEHNTDAYVDEDGSIVVRYHDTEILRAYETGEVEILTHHDSFTTRKRYNTYTNARVHNWKGTPLVYGPFVGRVEGQFISFVLPMAPGFITGLDLQSIPNIATLAVGIRVGDKESSDTLAAAFEAMGRPRMAEIVREWRGRRFGSKPRFWKRLWTDPTADGMWLCNRSSGALVRPALRRDAIDGIPEGYELVDGFSYSAKGVIDDAA